MDNGHRAYLDPYLRAVRQHGVRLESLLWASPRTQAARFDAIARLCNPHGLDLLDVGCGRADLLDFLLARGIQPASYVGLEAVGEFCEAARSKGLARCTIVQADFIAEPARLLCGAEVIAISGSLNTLDRAGFYRTVRLAYQATSRALVFNFLSTPELAGAAWLNWYRPEEILSFARRLCEDVSMLDDYLQGDCTVMMRKG